MTALLFDLDGTLLDTLEDLTDATNHTLAQMGYPPRSLREIRSFVGNGARNQLRLSLPEGTAAEEIDRALALYKPYYTTHCQEKTRPYEGIPEVLAEMKLPIAIVSNKPDAAVRALCGKYFPGIYALGERADCPRKPAPDMLYRAMEALGADKAVYIGDSEVDILTAKNAGMPCLSVTWGFRDREELEKAGAEYFCEVPEDLPNALERIFKG